MDYKILTKLELPEIAGKYLEYYNQCENGSWSYEKAYKRIHQIMTMEDSMCLIQYDDTAEISGFMMGYYKQFDDLKVYFLEEVVIFAGGHNKGYGTALLKEVELRIKQNGADRIELISVSDEHHMHFYTKAGFRCMPTLTIMGKYF